MAEAEQTGPSWLLRADRLVGLAAALLVACIAALAIGLILLANMQENFAREGARTRTTRSAVFTLMQSALITEISQRDYLFTGEQRFHTLYQSNVETMRGNVSALRDAVGSDQQLAPGAEAVEAEVDRALGVLAAPVNARANGRLSPAQVRAATLDANLAMEKLRASSNALLQTVEQRADAVRAQNASARAALFWGGGFLALLSVLTAALAAWAIKLERRAWRDALGVMVRANQESEVARAKAAASDLAKTRFLAAASHDMRQPLHALTLYLSALQRRVEGEEARGILSKMERATHSLVGMFNTLLDLARIQAEVVKPEVEVFPLQDVIERVVAAHPDADVAGPSAELTMLQTRTDPVLLDRLLRNLVSNALRHGGGSARIEVTTKDGKAEIAVVDSGPGIAQEDQDRIFEEFVRLDGRAGGEGLGLGLAIVQRIAALLNAELDLQSAPGQGARFIVRVPLEGDAAVPKVQHAATPPSLAGARVLVMDDDALALEAAAGVLRDMGAEVRACANEAAVNAALDDGFTPQVLVMDLRIDGELAGVAIAERARMRVTPPPPIVMVTGDTGPETLGALRASGHAWLIKPVSHDDLAAAVSAAESAQR